MNQTNPQKWLAKFEQMYYHYTIYNTPNIKNQIITIQTFLKTLPIKMLPKKE